MAENAYEGMFIFDSHRYGRDPQGVSEQLAEIVKKAGGEMLVSRLWEERRLAYPIRGLRKGTYWLTYFRLDADRLADVRRQCRLDDNILRVLFLKIDPRIVDTLVEHAKSGHIGKATEHGEERGPKAAGNKDATAATEDKKADAVEAASEG
ncbi:MAG: 30S ribosomal protein S6 [Candidatus Nealsonbacteria bacterium]|nr:30S ribosomal protein S6 [Candidatus Nealsonbacteria bacterium]